MSVREVCMSKVCAGCNSINARYGFQFDYRNPKRAQWFCFDCRPVEKPRKELTATNIANTTLAQVGVLPLFGGD